VLLLGGTQYQWYRVETALRALAIVRRAHAETRLIVTGALTWRSDETAALKQMSDLAHELGIEDGLEWIGRYTQAEAPDLYRRAHVLVHTKYNDPCPGVVLEALASGLPVVHSRSGGVPELVGDAAGIGVPVELSWERDIPPDPHAVADGVLTVMGDLAAFREAARTRAVERFDLRRWLARHRTVFEALA
jgi:glycosyltransferase involved in cell wall biosynthesis